MLPMTCERENTLLFDREVRVEQNVYDISLQLWKTLLKDYVHTPMFRANPKAVDVEKS